MKKLLLPTLIVNLIAMTFSLACITINAPTPPPQTTSATRNTEPLVPSERSLVVRTPSPAPVSTAPPGGAPGQTLQSGEAVIRNDIFTVNTRELTNPFNLPGNNTAQMWRITVEFASTQTQRLLRWEVQGDMPAQGVYVNVYRLPNDQRAPGEGTPPLTIKSTYMYRGDALYIRAVNSQTRPQNVTVRVTEEFELSINPPAVTLPLGGRQAFEVTRKGTNISPGVTWSVAEGPAGGSISSAGVYTAPNKAGTYRVVAVATEGPTTMRVDATVTVLAPTTSPTPPAQPSPGTVTGGAWVLKNTKTELSPNGPVGPNPSYKVSGTGFSGNTRYDWVRGPGNEDHQTSAHTISPATLPQRLVPGQKLQFTMEQTSSHANGGISVKIYVVRDGTLRDFERVYGTPPNSGPLSVVKDWTVPYSARYTSMQIVYTGGGPGGSASTYYIYDWVD